MAKKANKQAKTRSSVLPKKQRSAKGAVRRRVGGLDNAARDYAKLLADPCYGNIVPSTYSSAGSGNFIRLESDFILGAEATSVGAAIIFTPGLLSLANSCAVQIPTTVVNSDSSTIVWTSGTTLQPGYNFAGTIGACRAVSACLQVSYVGPEQTRAGLVALYQTTTGAALNAVTTAAMRSTAERVVRTPDSVLEIKLKPTPANEGMVSPLSVNYDYTNMPALCACVTGIPSSTGMRFRLVQVLEWVPKAASGVISSAMEGTSNNTTTQVLRAMDAANPHWQYELLSGIASVGVKALTWI